MRGFAANAVPKLPRPVTREPDRSRADRLAVFAIEAVPRLAQATFG
jgi:hypothetical protein